MVQLSVQALTVTLARVALLDTVLWGWLDTTNENRNYNIVFKKFYVDFYYPSCVSPLGCSVNSA